jgi:hypothetical protein
MSPWGFDRDGVRPLFADFEPFPAGSEVRALVETPKINKQRPDPIGREC